MIEKTCEAAPQLPLESIFVPLSHSAISIHLKTGISSHQPPATSHQPPATTHRTPPTTHHPAPTTYSIWSWAQEKSMSLKPPKVSACRHTYFGLGLPCGIIWAMVFSSFSWKLYLEPAPPPHDTKSTNCTKYCAQLLTVPAGMPHAHTASWHAICFWGDCDN